MPHKSPYSGKKSEHRPEFHSNPFSLNCRPVTATAMIGTTRHTSCCLVKTSKTHKELLGDGTTDAFLRRIKFSRLENNSKGTANLGTNYPRLPHLPHIYMCSVPESHTSLPQEYCKRAIQRWCQSQSLSQRKAIAHWGKMGADDAIQDFVPYRTKGEALVVCCHLSC